MGEKADKWLEEYRGKKLGGSKIPMELAPEQPSTTLDTAQQTIERMGKVQDPLGLLKRIASMAGGVVAGPILMEMRQREMESEGVEDPLAAYKQMGKTVGERYGGFKKIIETAQEDPIGTGLDAAALLGIGGYGLKKLGVSMPRVKLPEGKFRDIIRPFEDRIKTEPGKQLVSEMYNVHRKTGRRMGEFLVELHDSGISRLNKADKGLVFDYLAQPKKTLTGKSATTNPKVIDVANRIKRLRDRMFFIARAKGVKVLLPDGSTRPMGRVTDLPRYLREDISRKLYRDLHKGISKAEKTLGKDELASSPMLAHTIDKIGYNKFNPQTLELAQHLVDKGVAKTLGEAMLYMDKSLYNELFNPFGSIERPRLFTWPDKFVERNAGAIMTRYIKGFSKRIAEIEQWGQGGETALKRLNDIRNISPEEAATARKGLQILTGEYEQIRRLSPGAQKALDFFIDYEMITKVGISPATISQLGQPFISYIPEAGVMRTIRGLKNLASSGGLRQVRSSGATSTAGSRALEIFAGRQTTKSVLGRVKEIATAPFSGLNRALAASGASVYNVAIRDWYKIANSSPFGARRAWARWKLRKFGIDPDTKLTGKSINEGVYQAATDSQLQRNIMRDPIWLNDPHLRPFGFLKRFTMRQYDFFKKNIAAEVKHGNVLPLIRATVGAQVGGELVDQTKNMAKTLFSGDMDYMKKVKLLDPDLPVWQAAIDNIAEVATMGLFSELFARPLSFIKDADSIDKAAGQYYSSFWRGLEFLTTPVIGSEVMTVLDINRKFKRQWATGGLGKAVEPLPYDVLAETGPYGYYLSKRLRPEKGKKMRIH